MKGSVPFESSRLKLTKPTDFGKLYDYFAPKIYRHVFIRTSSLEETEDITSKVFLKTWEYVKGRNKIENARAFLYKTADNLIIDWYRTKVATVSIDATNDFEDRIDPPDPLDLEKTLADKFDLDAVKSAIHLLNPNDQAALVMRFIDDLSIEEISSVLGKSSGAVAVQIHRALKSLAKLCTSQ